MKLGIAILTHGTSKDLECLKRFFMSLYSSDIPWGTLTTVYWDNAYPQQDQRNGGAGPTLQKGREEAIKQAMKDTDVVMLTETDYMVPKVWWKTVEAKFLEDPAVGVIGGLVTGDKHPSPYLGPGVLQTVPPEQRHGQEGWADYMFEGVWLNGVEGFAAFRTTFLEDGLKNIGGTVMGQRFSGFPFYPELSTVRGGTWKHVHIPGIVLTHSKCGDF